MCRKKLFLDSNFLRNYSEKEKQLKEALMFLEKKWEVYITSFTAIELKNNRTNDGLKTLKLLEYVKVLPSQMEFLEDENESKKVFSEEELLKDNNTERYVAYKKYIEITNIRYIFFTIEDIIKEYLKREINYNKDNWEKFAEVYLGLNNKKEEIDLIKNFYLELKSYIVDDNNFDNAKKKIYLMKIEQFFNIHQELSFIEKNLYMIGYLRIVEKFLSNKNIGNKSIAKRKNDFFDLGFLSTYYLDSDILTKDNDMIEEYKKIGYEELEQFNDYVILRPNAKEKTYEEIYEEIINLYK